VLTQPSPGADQGKLTLLPIDTLSTPPRGFVGQAETVETLELDAFAIPFTARGVPVGEICADAIEAPLLTRADCELYPNINFGIIGVDGAANATELMIDGAGVDIRQRIRDIGVGQEQARRKKPCYDHCKAQDWQQVPLHLTSRCRLTPFLGVTEV